MDMRPVPVPDRSMDRSQVSRSPGWLEMRVGGAASAVVTGQQVTPFVQTARKTSVPVSTSDAKVVGARRVCVHIIVDDEAMRAPVLVLAAHHLVALA